MRAAKTALTAESPLSPPTCRPLLCSLTQEYRKQ